MTSQTQNYTVFILFVSYLSKVIFTWIKTHLVFINPCNVELSFALCLQLKHVIKCGGKDRFGMDGFQCYKRKRK